VLCALHCTLSMVQVVVPNESKELVGEASKQALEAEVAPLAAALQRSGLQPDAVYMLPANHISNSAVSNYALPPEAAGPPGISACVFHTVLRTTVLARVTVQRATVLPRATVQRATVLPRATVCVCHCAACHCASTRHCAMLCCIASCCAPDTPLTPQVHASTMSTTNLSTPVRAACYTLQRVVLRHSPRCHV
jgi:hypothetical protein